jgi:uncharacterized membrane protein required for colicin V production
MIAILCVVLILVVAYAHFQEGMFNAAAWCFGTLLAGVVAFNFYEPVADAVGDSLRGTGLDDCEDAIALTILFALVFGALKAAVNAIAPREIALPGMAGQAGGAAVGLLTGYLLSGFLICVAQTLPVHENFLGMQPRTDPNKWTRRMFPPDEFWMRAMTHFNRTSLWSGERNYQWLTNFEVNYARHRRYNDSRGPLPFDPNSDKEPEKPAPPASEKTVPDRYKTSGPPRPGETKKDDRATAVEQGVVIP